MENKTIFDYLETHEDYESPCGQWHLTSYGDGTIRMSVGTNVFRVESESDIQDVLERELNQEVRFCTVCGSPMQDGYMVEDGDFYACSDECFEKDADERYGKCKWKLTDDMTEEEWSNANRYEFGEDSHHAYLGKDNKWHPDNTFYTEWY